VSPSQSSLHPAAILQKSGVEVFFLARHAESADPTVFHGYESDIDLGPNGRAQASRFGARADLSRVDLLVSSGQLRSLNTLESLGKTLGLKPRIIRGFHERKVGILQGTPTNAPNSPFAHTRKEWGNGNKEFTTEGGESYTQVRERVLGAMHELNDLCIQEHARFPLVVSHGLTMKILLLEWLYGGDTAHWETIGQIKNTALWSLHRPFEVLKDQGCLAHLD